jgi:mannosyltransferase
MTFPAPLVVAPVCIDGIVFSLQPQGGVSVYFRELLKRLRRDGANATILVDGVLQQAAPAAGPSLHVLRRTARLLERYRRCRLSAPDAAGVFHSSYYRRPENRRLPTVVTVHDFTYERCLAGPRRWLHSMQKFAAIREAQHIICVSQSTMDDLEALVGLRADQRASVILNGVSERFRPSFLQPAMPPFALFVGQRGGYKNFRLALEAMAYLPDLALECVGGGPLRPEELAAAPQAVRTRVHHSGFVDEERLNVLYNQALCLVYPSRYEGFGIPVAEAMTAGCPVVAIDCKAVCEVGGDALTIAEQSAAGLAEAVERTREHCYRADKVRRGLVRASRFSWEESYRATAAIYRELAISG